LAGCQVMWKRVPLMTKTWTTRDIIQGSLLSLVSRLR
jgi:hypothetical protein